MHNLALYYFRGEAGPRDLAQAAAWFRRAAEAGVADSQYNLGLLYEAGSGVARDPAEAYKWFSIAANGGDDQARANAAALSARLSPAALAAAESQVQAFHPRSAIAAQFARDPALAAAQQVLARLGYYDGPRDGTLSAPLKLALSAYQHDNGLAVTGALDAPTAAKLAVLAR
jgi:localization factor PodJL